MKAVQDLSRLTKFEELEELVQNKKVPYNMEQLKLAKYLCELTLSGQLETGEVTDEILQILKD